MPPARNKSKPVSSRRRRIWWVTFLTVALLSLTFAGYCFGNQGKLLPRLYVGDVLVGGLTPVVAQAKLTNSVATLQSWEISVEGAAPTKVDLTTLADFDIEGMVIAAQRYSAGDTVWQWFVRRVKSLLVRQASPVTVAVDTNQLRDGLQAALYDQHDNEAKGVSLLIRAGKVTVKGGEAGRVVDRDAVERSSLDAIYHLRAPRLAVQRVDFQPEFTVADAALAQQQAQRIIATPLFLTWDGGEFGADQATISGWVTAEGAGVEDGRYVAARQIGAPDKPRLLLAEINSVKVTAWLTKIADQIERLPDNATVSFTDGSLRLTSAGRDGLRLKTSETVLVIRQVLLARGNGQIENKVAAVVELTPPSVSQSNIQNLGIKELIGRAATDYTGSPENRRKNIALGAQKMSGRILLPNEEWSSIKAIGPVDGAHGFLPEKVILSNKLELQYGGGLCQPITTLFRAILDAGLPVTERQNHSRRVSYYEKPSPVKGVRINWDANFANIGSGLVGYDATMYDPKPDLKFKNDTGQAVLVQAFVTNDKVVTFELYGTNDGRQVTVSKAQVLYTKAPNQPIYEDDPTLPTGTEKQTDKPVPGAKTSFTYAVKYPDGHTDSRDFISIYKPVSPRFLRGTGPVPAPSPETPPPA